MITIMCGKSKCDESNINPSATITINDDATVTEVMFGIVKAMIFEGYSVKSINKIIEEINSSLDKNNNTYDVLTDIIYYNF